MPASIFEIPSSDPRAEAGDCYDEDIIEDAIEDDLVAAADRPKRVVNRRASLSARGQRSRRRLLSAQPAAQSPLSAAGEHRHSPTLQQQPRSLETAQPPKQEKQSTTQTPSDAEAASNARARRRVSKVMLQRPSLHMSETIFDDVDSENGKNVDNDPILDARSSDKKLHRQFARRETQTVECLRWTIFTSLVLLAVGTCTGVYVYISTLEQDQFDSAFHEWAQTYCTTVRTKYQHHVHALQGFAYDNLAVASTPRQNNTRDNGKPFSTIPNIEQTGQSVADVAELLSILVLPYLDSEQQRLDFQQYAIDNQQWLQKSLDFQRSLITQREQQLQLQQQDQASSSSSSSSTTNSPWLSQMISTADASPSTSFSVDPISSSIQSIDTVLSDGTIVYAPLPTTNQSQSQSQSPRLYTPIWQMVPAVNQPDVILADLLSDPYYQPLINQILASLDSGEASDTPAIESILGPAVLASDLSSITATNADAAPALAALFPLAEQKWYQLYRQPYDAQADIRTPNITHPDEPSEWYLYNNVISNMLVPIQHQLNADANINESNNTSIAETSTTIFVAMFSWDALLSHDFSEKAQLLIVLQDTCSFVDGDDLDSVFSYRIHGKHSVFLGADDIHDSRYDDFVETCTIETPSCSYDMTIYATDELHDEFVSNAATSYTIMLSVVFFLLLSIMLCFDRLVERRQQVVFKSAMASSAIVSSLFPDNVRKRLYNDTNHQSSSMQLLKAQPSISKFPSANGFKKHIYDPKNTMDSYLTKLKAERTTVPSAVSTVVDVNTNPPIADLFQHCTVLFADIVGFASWSSGREAADVFMLLETIYNAFDKIANKRKVFKVETIGDCYLAVTGLPEPQEDHAIIMALFAHECLRKMKALIARELRNQLGGDTSSLSMRFGLHSGPVTAGVLRGEKSRFQLFGDTVNTAARMESTGRRHKIHVSKETAAVLVQAGKAHWVEERKDVVEAKGKGKLQTFWLRPRAYNPSRDKDREELLRAQTTSEGKTEGETGVSPGYHLTAGGSASNGRIVDGLPAAPAKSNVGKIVSQVILENTPPSDVIGGGPNIAGRTTSISLQEEGLVGTSFGATPMDDVSDIDEEDESIREFNRPPTSLQKIETAHDEDDDDDNSEEFETALKGLDDDGDGKGVTSDAFRPKRRSYHRSRLSTTPIDTNEPGNPQMPPGSTFDSGSIPPPPPSAGVGGVASALGSPVLSGNGASPELFKVHVKQTPQSRREMAAAYRSARLGR